MKTSETFRFKELYLNNSGKKTEASVNLKVNYAANSFSIASGTKDEFKFSENCCDINRSRAVLKLLNTAINHAADCLNVASKTKKN